MNIDDHTYTRNGATYIDAEYYRFLQKNELLINGSEGGLLQGPSLEDGGIILIGYNQDAEIFVAGKAEGWFYLINAYAEKEHRTEIESLRQPESSLMRRWFKPYPIPDGIRVINVNPKEINGQLYTPVIYFLSNFMGYATRRGAKDNLVYLDQINRESLPVYEANRLLKPPIRESAVIARLSPKNNN